MIDRKPAVPSSGPGKARRPGQRRKFLVNRRYQLKIALLAVAVVLALVLLLDISLYTAAARETEQALSAAPEFADYLQAQDRSQLQLIFLASLVFIIGVFLVSLLESHKTAGAAVNIRNRMEEFRNGKLQARVRLRKDDNLLELEEAFNAMASSLEETARREAEVLERLAARLEQAGGEEEAAAVAMEIRAFNRDRRRDLD